MKGRKGKMPNIRLKKQRLLKGWSQSHLAQQIQTDAFTVGRWERGESNPGRHFRDKLRTLFNVDDDALGLS